MKGTVGFKDHQITCIIGVCKEERTLPQNLYVDLRVIADLSRCTETDSLGDAIDYVALARLCTELAEVNQYRLIETFAAEVIKQLHLRFAIEKAWIKIKKPNGLLSADFAFVELSSDGLDLEQ